MIRFTSKIERAVAEATEEALKKGREEGIKEGREEGRVEIYRAWADWNKQREEAEAKDTSFDEPPPPNPENGTGK